MSGAARCLWCHRPGPLVELRGRGPAPGGGPVFAHAEHVAPLEDFLASADASARRLLARLALVLAAAIVALPVATVVGPAARNAVAAVAIIAVGMLALRHPLAPPPAVHRLGALAARRLSRTIAIATLVIGALLLVASFGL